MPDYKSMYYHLAGRMATAVDVLEMTTDVLEATTDSLKMTTEALSNLKEKLKLAQQATEELFLSGDDDEPTEEN